MDRYAIQVKSELPLYRVVRCIVQIRARLQRGVGIAAIQCRRHIRIAHSNVAAGSQKHFLPDPHVFVRRRGIPVNPSNSQVLFAGRGYFESQCVGLAVFQVFRHVKFVGAIGSRDFLLSREFLAVDPDVGAVVDAQKMQERIRVFRGGWRGKFRAIPPGAPERAVLGHVLYRKKCFARVIHPRNRLQIHCIVRIGIRLVRNQRAYHRRGNLCLVPRGGVKSRNRNFLSRSLRHARRLQLPSLVQKYLCLPRRLDCLRSRVYARNNNERGNCQNSLQRPP